MFRSITLAAVLATTFCLPALAELGPPREAAPLSRLFPMFEDYLALDQDKRSHFELTYALNASDDADNGFRLWVERENGNVDITRTDDGLVDMDQIVGLLPGNPMIMTDLPAGRGSVSMKLLPTLELGDEIAMEDVCTALSQANAAIRKQAGLMSFAAPKMKGIGFNLQPGTEVILKKPDGGRETLASYVTLMKVEPRRKDCRSGDTLAFSKPPVSDDFTT